MSIHRGYTRFDYVETCGHLFAAGCKYHAVGETVQSFKALNAFNQYNFIGYVLCDVFVISNPLEAIEIKTKWSVKFKFAQINGLH